MSKRDDDSQADLEVGMTTAERRRRRRRGGGLRVPSDNVPRRSTTPPVVAPVPEDPSLAMSIAYSFTSDSSQPVRAADDDGFADPVAPEAISTVIDAVSGPIEQADFEMKTREMSAVDLDALGLSDAALAAIRGPSADITIPDPPARDLVPALGTSGVDIRFRRPARADSSEELVELSEVSDASDGGDGGEVSLPPRDVQPARRERLQTVALSDEDLEEVREAVRGATMGAAAAPPPVRGASLPPPGMTSMPRPHTPTPPPPIGPITLPPRAHTPTPAPPSFLPATGVVSGTLNVPAPMPPPAPTAPPAPAAVPAPMASAPAMASSGPPRAQRSAASEMWDEETPPPRAAEPAPMQASMPGSLPGSMQGSFDQSRPTPIPASVQAADQSSRTQPLTPLDLEPDRADASVPELDLQDLSDRAESSGEFEVDVEEAVEVRQDAGSGPVKRGRAPTAPPPLAPSASTTNPGVPPPPAPAPPSLVSAQMAAVSPPAGATQASQTSQASQASQASGIITPPPVQAATLSPPAAHGASGPAGHAPSHPPGHHAHPPPPPPAALHHHPHKPPAPPAPPAPAKKEPAPAAAAKEPPGRGRAKPWFVELFDEDYLRTLPFLTPQATQAEAEFVSNAMGLTPGAQVLDVGCGYGRHAMELAARGFHVVGLDSSTSLLLRGGEEAQRRGLQINFVRGDMRELDFDAQFDGAYCLFSTFGYFDDETNKKTVANIARALKPGGRILIEILNRDYVIADLPTRVWWEGDGCVVLEEVELNYFSSRIQVNRSVVFDDGRQLEQEISIRAYSLHEVGKLMHAAGFRVLEVSGGFQTRGRFFGNQSRHIIVLAERKDPAAS